MSSKTSRKNRGKVPPSVSAYMASIGSIGGKAGKSADKRRAGALGGRAKSRNMRKRLRELRIMQAQAKAESMLTGRLEAPERTAQALEQAGVPSSSR